MSDHRSISCVRSKRRWIVAVLLTFTAGLTGLVLWFGGVLAQISHR